MKNAAFFGFVKAGSPQPWGAEGCKKTPPTAGCYFRSRLLTACLLLLVMPACAQTPPKEFVAGPEPVSVPPLPGEASFAGEALPLQNYDTRESLERELVVSLYMHSRTLFALLNTTRYFPVIEPILEQNGIPDDFKYLCMAESGLNPNVVSPAGAVGLWQLMPAVGREHGMIVTTALDERYHIEKATQAACDYLNDAYKQFGSWTLAAAAYNLGPAGVARRIDKQKTTSYYDTFLPEETMRYLFRIISLKLITQAPDYYGYVIDKAQFHHPLTEYRVAEVKGAKIDWAQVAREQGTNYKILRELNHWIRDYDYSGAERTFRVKIPLKNFRE